MLILSESDVKKAIDMRGAIESDREAFVIQAEGKAELSVRTSFNVAGRGRSSFMPAYVSAFPLAGAKIVSTFSGNMEKNLPVVCATVLLLDPETGMVNAIIDGTELTRMRTGAVSGLATELLSNEDAEAGALFGVGGQALSQLEAVLTVRKLREVRIFDKFEDRIAPFVELATPVAERLGARLKIAASSDEAIDQADVITTVTTTTDPVFDGSRVKLGAHVNGVGTYEPHKRELDENIIRRADRIFIDNMEAIMAEAGDLLIPMSEGKIDRDAIAGELGDLILGRVKGRTSKDQITVMKTVGFATLDIVIAHHIYDKAAEMGIGIRL
ncbi:MAG: ornithine cyclodeaminase family protein [Synergistaceae bacterium]|jgi:ornithine cyclodeaminase|nr:ornithine cyclodeaminase family protein [Synergistaceae bacterium]